MSATIAAQRIALTELADSYEKAAEGTYRIGETVSGIMKDITDAAMVGAVAASAGTATIETGIGFVTGWGIAAHDVRRGNATLGDFLASSEYAAALRPGLAGFGQWYAQLSDDERAEQADRIQAELDGQDTATSSK